MNAVSVYSSDKRESVFILSKFLRIIMGHSVGSEGISYLDLSEQKRVFFKEITNILYFTTFTATPS